MTPDAFIDKWRASTLKESSASKEHFLDLCRLLDEPTPAEADPKGEAYGFEKGATKTTGGEGWADVWKRGCFAWEYKGKGKDLTAAYAQLQKYAPALENPPLLIVSDMETIIIHTNWTNSVRETYAIPLDELRIEKRRRLLKWAFSDPERLRPGKTRQKLTEEVAEEFARLALRLRERGHEPHKVAHFVNRLVFGMFAEDVGLLPNQMLSRLLEQAHRKPENFIAMARDLFRAMKEGGRLGLEEVAWFNGGLFDDDEALPLTKADIETVLNAAKQDWAEIDPSILGTLFERGLDPDKRSQLGAHYTDRDKVMLIVEPVILRPLEREWAEAKARIEAELAKAAEARARRPKVQAEARKVHRTARQAEERAEKVARELYAGFHERLRAIRVLDPACGSGNFLYLALLALKDFEHRVGLEGEVLGLGKWVSLIGPECVLGIEINPYAAELARVSVWIGEIQWMLRNGYTVSGKPILKPLDTIQCRDAILNEDGSEPEWPAAECIIGNPPFLGGKLMRDTLGDSYVDRMFAAYDGHVPAEADLVCYWFDKAWRMIERGAVHRVGLVATNSIRGGANRALLDRIVSGGVIFDAWDDEPWIVDGAAVRVSLVCFAKAINGSQIHLDAAPVARVHADLTSGAVDLTVAKALKENKGIAFMGDTKGGPFDIPGDLARQWLQLPLNPNGRPNRDVLKPWMNGMDVTRRPSDKWIIDFGWAMSEAQASLYEAPFSHVLANVKPCRIGNKRESYRDSWWRHVEPRQGFFRVARSMQRWIVTARVSKHRLFVWVPSVIVPDSATIAIARDDDPTFGILHSRFHELWSIRKGTFLGVGNDPRYTPTTTFETFPFPDGLTPNIPAAQYADDPRAKRIAGAAKRLNEMREAWLNPSDLVERVPEVVAGYPDRIVPKNAMAAVTLRTRTLTNLYNERPVWLANLHKELDEAVAAAYGWPADLTDDEILKRLLDLNLARAAAQEGSSARKEMRRHSKSMP